MFFKIKQTAYRLQGTNAVIGQFKTLYDQVQVEKSIPTEKFSGTPRDALVYIE